LTISPTPDFALGESQPMRWGRVLAWIFGGLLMGYFYAYFMAISSGDVELATCHQLESAVEAKHSLPASTSSPGRPAIFCDRAIQLPLLARYEKVYVYGVLDGATQDAIVGTLRDFYRERRSGKALVEFFEKENWQTWSSPATGESGGRRGPETPLRSLWIKP
jgi:hypothetical protein